MNCLECGVFVVVVVVVMVVVVVVTVVVVTVVVFSIHFWEIYKTANKRQHCRIFSTYIECLHTKIIRVTKLTEHQF